MGSPSPPSLGALIGTVVAGSTFVGVCLGVVLLHLFHRREARQRNLSGEAVNVTTVERGVGRTKKKSFDVDDDETRINRSPSRLYKTRDGRVSPVRPTPLPVIPPLFARRTSFNPFSGNRSGATTPELHTRSNSTRRANAAWIDEDALHGPKVGRGQQEADEAIGRGGGAGGGGGGGGGSLRRKRRLTVRASWPMGNQMPTLPQISGPETEHDDQRWADELAGHELRQLPDPPMAVVVNSVGGLCLPEDGGRQRLSPSIILVRRNPSTDSSLSEILRNTERRIQEGTMTGMTRRNRAAGQSASSSPTKRETLVGMAVSADSSTATLMQVDSLGRRTPSPTKSTGPVAVPQYARSHWRDVSQSSVVSDTDSLYGDTDKKVQDAPPVPDVPVGLNRSRSASRRREAAQEQQQPSRPKSMRSSVSSALSTVYSEDESANTNTSHSNPTSSQAWSSWSMNQPRFFPVPTHTFPNLNRPGDDPFVFPDTSSVNTQKTISIPGLTLLQRKPLPNQRGQDSQREEDGPDVTPTKVRCEVPLIRNTSSSPTLGHLSLYEQTMPYFPRPSLARAASNASSAYSQDASVISRYSTIRRSAVMSTIISEYPDQARPLPVPPDGYSSAGIMPLVSAVAELRRMNSIASTIDSHVGTIEDQETSRGIRPESPAPKRNTMGNRNYLAVGRVAASSARVTSGSDRTSRRLSAVARAARDDSDGGEEHDSGKENRDDAMPLKMPKVDFSLPGPTTTPAMARLKALSATYEGGRDSVESLGLYDKEGFLKSSPVRDSVLRRSR